MPGALLCNGERNQNIWEVKMPYKLLNAFKCIVIFHMIEIDPVFLQMTRKFIILVLDLDLPQKISQNLLLDEIPLLAKAP